MMNSAVRTDPPIAIVFPADSGTIGKGGCATRTLGITWD